MMMMMEGALQWIVAIIRVLFTTVISRGFVIGVHLCLSSINFALKLIQSTCRIVL